MKNTISVFLLFFLLHHTKGQDSIFVLLGQIEGVQSGMIYLTYRDLNAVNFVDSTLIENGTFSYKGNIKEPAKLYLYSNVKQRKGTQGVYETEFFIEPTVMQVQLINGKFNEVKLTGSKTQDEWVSYNEIVQACEAKWEPVLLTIKKAEQEKNWPLYDSLTNKYMIPYTDEKEWLTVDFIRTNPNSFVSLDLLSFNRHKLPFDSLLVFYQAFTPIIKQSNWGVELERFIVKEESLQIGKFAPDILFTDKDGVNGRLSDFKGKYVLLDFWASWCVPCREENPYLVDVYKKYQAKGFEIVSFSLDREKEKQVWLDAIVKDNMTWPQVCDFKYWNSEITKAFNLFGRGIPVNFLIDANGRIIGRDIRAWKLDAYLKEYMK